MRLWGQGTAAPGMGSSGLMIGYYTMQGQKDGRRTCFGMYNMHLCPLSWGLKPKHLALKIWIYIIIQVPRRCSRNSGSIVHSSLVTSQHSPFVPDIQSCRISQSWFLSVFLPFKYRKFTEFCSFYPAILFISSRNFGRYFGSFMFKIILTNNKDAFTFSFPVVILLIFFSCLIAPAGFQVHR